MPMQVPGFRPLSKGQLKRARDKCDEKREKRKMTPKMAPNEKERQRNEEQRKREETEEIQRLRNEEILRLCKEKQREKEEIRRLRTEEMQRLCKEQREEKEEIQRLRREEIRWLCKEQREEKEEIQRLRNEERERQPKQKKGRLAEQSAAVVQARLAGQYDAGMQPGPKFPEIIGFTNRRCTHSTSNMPAFDVVMNVDACDNSTLKAAAELVEELATREVLRVSKVIARYANLTIAALKTAQISGANPSGSVFAAGLAHPDGPVASIVMPRKGNLSCKCGEPVAANCTCLLGNPQIATHRCDCGLRDHRLGRGRAV